MAGSSAPDPRHLEIALHHANIIQHRKDVENLIFENMLQLTDFPLVSDHLSDSPDSSDMRRASQLLRPFQPSDWDNLVEERRGESKCGYVLCPNALHLPESKNAPKFMFWNTGGGVKILPREEVDKWCSVSCYKRANYVKAQLATEPAWSRKVEAPSKFTFMGKDSSNILTLGDDEIDSVEDGMWKLRLEDKKVAVPQSQLVLDEIVEKPTVTPAKEPSVGESGIRLRIDEYLD